MDSYAVSMRRYGQYFLYLLALLVLGWGFTSYQSVFLGLILGTVVSFLLLWSLNSKITRLGRAVVEGRKAYSIGTFTRLSLAGLSIFLAIQYPHLFHVIGVTIGILTAYIIIYLDFIIQKYKRLLEKR